MHKYVIVGNGFRAMAVHSDMLWFELTDYVRTHSKKIHKESFDVVFSWGTVDFVNPKVMLASEFADTLPALIGVK